jgi:predicted Rossmann fold flavoprotein
MENHVQPPPRRRRHHRVPVILLKPVICVQRFIAVARIARHDQNLPAHRASDIVRIPPFATIEPMRVEVAIVGAGAAGLLCAIEAGKRGRRVLVLEHNPQIARKILISGGGRCNFTNLHTAPDNFLSANPHFAKSALARHTPRDFIALVERHGIPYHEKTLGQLFCDRSARDIVAMLEAECAAASVEIRSGCAVRSITGSFVLDTSLGPVEAQSVVVATGGLSIPKMGATPFGYEIARQYGLNVIPCRPALVPLTWAGDDLARYGALAGISADAAVTAGRRTFREKLLFTHRGLSGPAVLQASSYWTPGAGLTIDLLPSIDLAAELRRRDRAEVRTIAARWLPKRLADVHAPAKPAAVLSDREIEALDDTFHRWRVHPAGSEGYDKAEVTAGGVDTAELSSKTMESKKVPGLYFIGEVVDVTGHLGGFNFQWAWASGYSAGQFV